MTVQLAKDLFKLEIVVTGQATGSNGRTSPSVDRAG
jgi:hypothetical protein